MQMFVFISFILHSTGLVCITTSQIPTTKDPILTDKHFDMLMDLILEQRRSQRKQDQKITQLQHNVLMMQQELALCKLNNQNNDSLETRFMVLEIRNKTDKLQKELEGTCTLQNVNSMKTEFQKKYATVKKSKELEHEIESLKRLKAFKDQHIINDVWNQTKHIENEVQKTNSRLDAIVSDAKARKEDFIALYKKAHMTEQQLSDRGIFSARLKEALYTVSQRLQYGSIEVANGIQNISSIKDSGVFTCEKDGIYHISVYITTNATQSRYFVLKNDKRFAEAFFSFGSNYQTGTTVFVTKMNVGDTIEIITTCIMYVFGLYESGITITQVQ